MNQQQLEVAAHHYLIAACWADAPEGTNPKVTQAAWLEARRAVQSFVAKIGPNAFDALMNAHADGYGTHPDCGKVEPAAAAMGHDLWLTRNGHGTGFYDRSELPQVVRAMCISACHTMGAVNFEFHRGWLYLR